MLWENLKRDTDMALNTHWNIFISHVLDSDGKMLFTGSVINIQNLKVMDVDFKMHNGILKTI